MFKQQIISQPNAFYILTLIDSQIMKLLLAAHSRQCFSDIYGLPGLTEDIWQMMQSIYAGIDLEVSHL